MVAANRLCLTCGTEYSGFITVCPEDQTRLTVLSQDERVGTVLAERYDILEIIGTGGMGTVYKARQRLINRIVAVKMLHKTMMSSADVLRRFQLEAQAASRLSLPNILTIYDFGLTDEGQPYMVMDYLNGTSLDKIILAQHHLEPVRALNIFIQACAALAHAHMHEVLHRDIKPSNIMLVNFDDQSDFVKIVDFGIAKMMNKIEGQAAELTKTGEVYGSPPYMSPEQCRGLDLDNRADIYSLACVLYKSLVGKNPMQTSGDSMPLQIMLKHINEKAPSFAEAAPDLFLSSKLEAVVFKALEKNPDDRYQTMLEFKDALEKIREVLVAESKVSQHMKETMKEENDAEDVAGAPETSSGNQAPAPNQAPKPRKQIVDDPTPHLPTATVPLEQQLSPAAADALNSASQWTEVSQSTLGAPKPQAPVSHNLSPSEFLSTLNSQLTQSAQAPSPQPTPQPLPQPAAQPLTQPATQAAPSAVPAPGNGQNPETAIQPQVQPQLQVPLNGGAPPAISQSAASDPNANGVKPGQAAHSVPRSTFAEALQAALPSPDTQMLSIVQTPNAQGAAVKAGQATIPPGAENAVPAQDRRAAKALVDQSPQPNLQPPVRAQIIPNMPPAPSSQMLVQTPAVSREPSPVPRPANPLPPNAQLSPMIQLAQPAQPSAVIPPIGNLQPAASVQSALAPQPSQNLQPPVVGGPPITSQGAFGQPAPSINLQQTVNTVPSPNVPINATNSSRVRVSQTLKEMPRVEDSMPTLRESPALAIDLPGTSVESKIPISVLDSIKSPAVKSTKTNLDMADAVPERVPNRPKSRRFEEPTEADRAQRLSENRRKFIKHETDSSKTMLMVASVAFVAIVVAFFSFSYFNSMPKQPQSSLEQPTSSQTQAAATVDNKTLTPGNATSSAPALNDVKHTPIAQPTKTAVSGDSTGGTTSRSSTTNEIASVAPVGAKSHKIRKAHAAAAPTAPPAPANAGSGARRHAYSSYGMSY